MNKEMTKQHGAFSWNELMTTDMEGAKAFYAELLGWRIKPVENADPAYLIASVGDREIAGFMTKPPKADNMPSSWGCYVTVDNVDRSVEKAQALGGEVLVEPREIDKVGRFAVIKDPQGAFVSLITYSK